MEIYRQKVNAFTEEVPKIILHQILLPTTKKYTQESMWSKHGQSDTEVWILSQVTQK